MGQVGAHGFGRARLDDHRVVEVAVADVKVARARELAREVRKEVLVLELQSEPEVGVVHLEAREALVVVAAALHERVGAHLKAAVGADELALVAAELAGALLGVI